MRGGGAASPGPSCARAFGMFRDRGVPDVRLNVDRDNPTGATHLYEQAGMRLRRRWLMVSKTMTAVPDDASDT